MKLPAVLFLLLVLSCGSFAQDRCDEYSLADGALAFCPPADWSKKRSLNGRGVRFEGPTTDRIAVNLSISEFKLDASHEASVQRVIQLMLGPQIEGAKLLSVEDFKTASGLTGTKFVTEWNLGRSKYRSRYYCFDGPGIIKLLFALASSQSDAASESTLDDALKTLHYK